VADILYILDSFGSRSAAIEFTMSEFVRQEEVEKRFSDSNKIWYSVLTH